MSSSGSFLQSRAMLVIGAVSSLVVIAAVAAVFLGDRRPPGGEALPAADHLLFRDFNFAVARPPGWTVDEDAKRAIRANAVAMAQADSPARFAIAVSNFRTRLPQPGELRDGLVADRLERMFEDLDVQTAAGEWLGQPALKLQFRGRKGAETYAGEAFAVGVHGIAYWFLGWTLESRYAEAVPEFDAIRRGCRLLESNVPWAPSAAGIRTFTGNAANYTLVDGDQWWEKQSEPTSEDPRADMLLKAKFRVRQRTDFPPTAWAAVFLLPPADDARTAAVEYVKSRYRALGLAQFEEVTGPAFGDPPAAGMPERADAVRLHARGDDPNGAKLVVINAIRIGDIVIGVECWCPWNERARWESRLIAFAASLRP